VQVPARRLLPGLAERPLRVRAAWVLALLGAMMVASPLLAYIDQAGPQVTRQTVEDFNAGHRVVPGALSLEPGYRVNEYGYFLPAHQSSALYYRIAKPRESGLAMAVWAGVEPVNLPGTIAVSLDDGPYQELAYDPGQARKVLALPAGTRAAASVVLRITAQNRSSNDRLVLDQLEWTDYQGSAVSPPSALIPLGLALLAAVLAFAFIRPQGWWSAAIAAAVGTMTGYATSIRATALQAYAMTQLDPDAGVYRTYGERFQWWPPTKGLFCGCYSEREPFYPMVLHADFSILGSADFHVRILSFTLSLLVVPLAIAAARRLVSWPWALAVGAAVALNAPLVGESWRGLRTELEMCLVLITFLALSRAWSARPWLDGAGSGLAAAALVLTRIFFLPSVVAAATIGMLSRGRRRWVAAGSLALALGLPMLAFAGHKVALYETPHKVNYAALHDFNVDTNGYNRWNANVEKFDQGRPLPHPELFPTAEQYHRDGPYSGPPLSTWQYLFVIHTPQEIVLDSLAGYLDIWRNTDGITLPGEVFRNVGPFLDLLVRWLGLAGLVGLMASSRRVPVRLLIPAIVVISLGFAAFPYHRELTERYRHTYQVYPLFLIAAAWAGQAGLRLLWAHHGRAWSVGRPQLTRSTASTAAAVVGVLGVLAVVSLQLGTPVLAAIAVVAVLCLAAAAFLDAPIASATIPAVLVVAGTRLGLVAAVAVAAGAVAASPRVVLARLPRLAPLVGVPLVLVLAGAGSGAQWHPSRAAVTAGLIAVGAMLAATAALASPAGRVRMARSLMVVAAGLAVAALLGLAAPAGTLPPKLGVNGILAAILAPALPLAAWLWKNQGGWAPLAALMVEAAALMLAAPLLGLVAVVAAGLVLVAGKRPGWPALAAALAGIVALAVVIDLLVATGVPPGWRSYLASTQDTLVQEIDPARAQGADRLFIYGRRAAGGARYHLVAEADGRILAGDVEEQLPTAAAGWIAIPLAGPPPSRVTLRVTGDPNPGNAYVEVGGVYAAAPGLSSDLLVAGRRSRPDLSVDPGFQRGTVLVLPGDRRGPFDFGLRLPGYSVRSPLDLPTTARRAGEGGAPLGAAAQASTLRLWPAALQVAAAHPLLGTGIGSLDSQLENAGFGPGLTARDQFLQTAAEGGLLGLAALVAALAATVLAALRAGPARGARFAVLAAIVACLTVQAPFTVPAAAAAIWLALAWVLLGADPGGRRKLDRAAATTSTRTRASSTAA
jgi:hypothetical protein